MAIRKREVNPGPNDPTEWQLARVKELEEAIDQAIVRQYVPGGKVLIEHCNCNEAVRKELKRRYHEAGWQITFWKEKNSDDQYIQNWFSITLK